MTDIITIIFVFLNSFIIVGVIFYGIKKNVVPSIEKSAREYALFIYNLQSDYKNLQMQIQGIAENIQDQDRHFHALQKKFHSWQKKCHERVVLHESEDIEIHKNMQQRHTQRSEIVKHHKIIQKEMPHILDAVSSTLQKKYQDQQIQKLYIDELIHTMKDLS